MDRFQFDWDLHHERVTLSAIVRLHECQIFLFNILHNMRWRKQRTGKLSLRKSFPYNIIRAIENVILSFLESWFLHPTYKMTFSKSLIRENNPFCDRYSKFLQRLTLHKKSPYSEFFWSAFFPDFLAFGQNLSVFSPNAGKSGKSSDQNNSEYGLFLRRVTIWQSFTIWKFLTVWSFNFFFTLLHGSLFFAYYLLFGVSQWQRFY